MHDALAEYSSLSRAESGDRVVAREMAEVRRLCNSTTAKGKSKAPGGLEGVSPMMTRPSPVRPVVVEQSKVVESESDEDEGERARMFGRVTPSESSREGGAGPSSGSVSPGSTGSQRSSAAAPTPTSSTANSKDSTPAIKTNATAAAVKDPLSSRTTSTPAVTPSQPPPSASTAQKANKDSLSAPATPPKPTAAEVGAAAVAASLASPSRPLPPPKSALDVERALKTLMAPGAAVSGLLDYIKQLPPAGLASLFKESLSSSIVAAVVNAVDEGLESDPTWGVSILTGLSNVNRFGMSVMQLGRGNKDKVRGVFEKLEAGGHNVKELRAKYKVL
jgi:hypothetical protein